MVEVFERLGDKGFSGNDRLMEGVHSHSSFDWEKIPAYYLSDYFKLRTQESVPLNEHEQVLFDFLRCYSVHLDWPSRPASDLPVQSSVVFKPERVQKIAAALDSLNLEKALEWYDCAIAQYVADRWPRDLMLAHLRKVVALWSEAAARNEAVLHTEF